ncbi:MAG: glucose-6-phosphate dehydrogenase assembly protein OpcA [Verrucomicrobia bacterium]|nr:glucose-6-phosphate dehydrogenase assembly protein OpcA [Verrucomicrobiota bacterium]
MTTATHPVDPAAIQTELSRIWESLETTNTTRACLFNLIFFTNQTSRASYFRKIAQKVIEKFPARVLFVTADKESKEDFLKTSVSILSSHKGEFDVACDYIQIEAGGPSQIRIPFVVLPHILSDLPVYLISGEDPSCCDPVSKGLERFASRLIFDSECTDNLPRFAAGILQQKELTLAEIADLNWARMEDWRDLFSMVFYAKEKLDLMRRAKQITITYNAQETPFFCHTKIQALYLQAWLACQLEWEFKLVRLEKEAILFFYQDGPRAIEILIASEKHEKLPPGLILSVELTTEEGDHFRFQRNSERLHQITLQFSNQKQCDIPSHYIFSKAESGHSLVKEICHRGTSEHFLKVLNLLKKMEALGLC